MFNKIVKSFSSYSSNFDGEEQNKIRNINYLNNNGNQYYQKSYSNDGINYNIVNGYKNKNDHTWFIDKKTLKQIKNMNISNNVPIINNNYKKKIELEKQKAKLKKELHRINKELAKL